MCLIAWSARWQAAQPPGERAGAMSKRTDELLERIYGREAGRAAAARLADLLEGRRLELQAGAGPRPARPLDQGDALLIAYADQVREPGTPPLRTLARFCEKRLGDLVSGVHLLPFYPWSSDDGFSVKDYFAVDPELGGWEDIARLGRSFDLMFDAVFNHMSAQGAWFQAFLRDEPGFRDFFLTVEGEPDLSAVTRPRTLPLLTEFETARGRRKVWTTFSADQADLNFKNPRVLLAAMEALLFYATRGARFLRLDAIAFLWKEIGSRCLHLPQTHAIVQLMRAALDEVAPATALITETNVPHAENISYFGDGTNEAQLVYNFALAPLVLHSLAAGRADRLSSWAAGLRTPSDRTAFFNFLASHDGIGLNPARGLLEEAEIGALVEKARRHGGLVSFKRNPDGSQSPYELNVTWFDALNDPLDGERIECQTDRFMVSQAIMLALAGVPGIYFHSLFGSRNDRAEADASGMPRRINREKLRLQDLERDLANPGSLRARVFTRYARLLRLRRTCAAFDPRGPQEVLAADPRVFGLRRGSPDGRQEALCYHNLSAEAVTLPTPGGSRLSLRPCAAAWLVDGLVFRI